MKCPKKPHCTRIALTLRMHTIASAGIR